MSTENSEQIISNETWVTHLMALKKLVIIGGLFWLIGFIVALIFQEDIFAFVLQPLENILGADKVNLLLIRPTDGLVVLLKLCALASVIVNSPVLFYLLWLFIAPALKENERSFAVWFTFCGLILALIGGMYAYFAMIPASLELLLGITPKSSEVSLTLMEYVDFLLFLFVAVVLIFQTPIVVFILVLTRLVQPETLYNRRREIYIVIVIALAILTPTPDIVTLAFITIPVVVLYEVSILLARYFLKRNKALE